MDIGSLTAWMNEDRNGLVRLASGSRPVPVGESADELELDLAGDGDDGSRWHFRLRCLDVRDWDLRSCVADPLEWTDDHPVLWRFSSAPENLHFLAPATDPFAVIGRLWIAHESKANGWLELRDHLNDGGHLGHEWLLRQPQGLLASGPRALIDVYATALDGVLDFHRTPAVRREYDPNSGLRALVFDASYVVCRDVVVQRISPT